MIAKMTRDEFIALGRSSAIEAVDQTYAYGTRQNAIDNYFENLHDTLTEYHATREDVYAAEDAFYAELSKLK